MRCPGNFILEMNALPFNRDTEKYDLSQTYEYKNQRFTVRRYDPIRLMVHKNRGYMHFMMHRVVQKSNRGRGRFKLLESAST